VEPFATWEDVQRRVDFDLDEQERIAVSSALEDMSDEARFHAGQEWPNPELAPRQVRRIVVRAVARWAENMNGYVTSRAGDETLTWTDLGPEAGQPEFTKKEVKMLKALGEGRTGSFVGTVSLVAYSPLSYDRWDGTLPVQGSTKPFPFFNPLTNGW